MRAVLMAVCRTTRVESRLLTMSKPRKKMVVMARDNDIEGITHLLDEGVDPAAEEERDYVRPRDDLWPHLSWVSGCHGCVADDCISGLDCSSLGSLQRFPRSGATTGRASPTSPRDDNAREWLRVTTCVCVHDVDCRVETHRRTWLLGKDTYLSSRCCASIHPRHCR